VSSPFAVTIDKPPGQGWIRLPVGGPSHPLHRRRQADDDPADTAVLVTYLCRPPQIKAAVNFTMYWLIGDDTPALTEYADVLAATRWITVERLQESALAISPVGSSASELASGGACHSGALGRVGRTPILVCHKRR
jgi:hypothetical protein